MGIGKWAKASRFPKLPGSVRAMRISYSKISSVSSSPNLDSSLFHKCLIFVYRPSTSRCGEHDDHEPGDTLQESTSSGVRFGLPLKQHILSPHSPLDPTDQWGGRTAFLPGKGITQL